MKSYEQFFIVESHIYISRRYHIMSEQAALKDGYQWNEPRYAIHGSNGIKYMPATVYENFMRNECPAFQSFYKPTRNYKKDLDKTWFRYYDDAEEVLNNLVAFYKWACNLNNQKDKKIIKILSEVRMDVMACRDLKDTIIYPVGLPVRNRKDLSPLALMLANERDLKDQES